MNMIKIKKRENYIDLLRGLNAIGIVAIHTAFWSGARYTPTWFQSLTLLIDVPLFFFISGCALTYYLGDMYKTIKGISSIWSKWFFFIVIWEILCIVFGKGNVCGGG